MLNSSKLFVAKVYQEYTKNVLYIYILNMIHET